jgi:hypothetical protein
MDILAIDNGNISSAFDPDADDPNDSGLPF